MDKQNQVAEPLQNEIFQSIDLAFSKLKEGKIVEGEIVDLSPTTAVISIGFKSEGIVPLDEFEDKNEVKIGDKVTVVVEKILKGESNIILSKKKADAVKSWEELEKSFNENMSIKGRIMKSIKGGYSVNINGVEAFLPASQVDSTEEKNVNELIGKPIEFKVIKLDRAETNITLSRKSIAMEETKKKKEEIFQQIEEGQIVEGIVKNIADFGAFVDIGGADGLIHITDLAWSKINHPSEILKAGEKIKTKILKIDMDKKHISLGLKQLTPHPWENIEIRYPVGSTVKGKVTALTDYGAFIELETGIEGLVHISELSWGHISSPDKVVEVGDTIQVVILSIDKGKNKISLSHRQSQPNPWEKISELYPEGKTVMGTVKSFSKAGAFLELKHGLSGFLPLANISWTEHLQSAPDTLTKGKTVRAKIISTDAENQRIILGIKQLSKDPLIELKDTIGKELQTTIKEIEDKGLVVKFSFKRHKMEGFVSISQLAKQKDIKQYNKEETIKLKLIEVDSEKRKIILSEKEPE